MTITNYKNLDNNFIKEIEEFTEGEFFQLFYLFAEVNNVNYGSSKLNKAFILKDGKCQIIGLITDNAYYLFAKNWKKTQLEKISKISNLQNCPEDFQFLGTEKFIKELFILNSLELDVIKNRSFYKIEKSKLNEFKNENEIEKALISDTIEITHLYQQYYVEEYNGTSNKEFNDTKENVIKLIESNSILISKKNEMIMGFCTSMHKGTENPMIGTVFVNPEYRNIGIGKSLVHFTTRDLLKSANVVLLMTTKENIQSNKMVEKLGYFKIYDHTNGTITVGNTVYN